MLQCDRPRHDTPRAGAEPGAMLCRTIVRSRLSRQIYRLQQQLLKVDLVDQAIRVRTILPILLSSSISCTQQVQEFYELVLFAVRLAACLQAAGCQLRGDSHTRYIYIRRPEKCSVLVLIVSTIAHPDSSPLTTHFGM